MRATFLLGLALLSSGALAEVTIENIDAGETVRHPVVILRGKTHEGGVRAGLEKGNLQLFPAFEGKYTAFCELKPGKNFVVVRAGTDSVRMRLDYRPMKTPYKVHAVWAHASDEPEGASPIGVLPYGDFRGRFDVAMKLMQSFTAEAMHEAGYGRKTFALDLDDKGKVKVNILKLPKTGKELREMGGDSWGFIYGLLEKQIPGPNQRWMVLNAFSAFDAKEGKWLGHYALGGGQLAAFGAGTVPYFPASLTEVPKAFANRQIINEKETFEDSAYRRTVWANVATGYGAMLHELGHTFGLPHSVDGQSVMSRGFDFFNRSFMAYEPPSARNPKEIPVKSGMYTRWDPFFAARLNVNPWFQPDGSGGLRFAETDPPKIELVGEEIVLTSKRGIRVLGVDRDDKLAVWQEHKAAPQTRVVLKRSEMRTKMGDQTYRITAIDSEGNQTTIEDKIEEKKG